MNKRVCVYSMAAACAAASLSASAAPTSDWLQFGYDPTHSGINPKEFLLNAGNVHLLTLKYSKAFQPTVPGTPAPAQGTPVFLSSVTTSQGVIDMLFVTLNDGSILALNAANGAQVWANRPATVPACALPDENPQCLVTSSPAIDPNRKFVYNFSRLDGKIHKFAVATGVETTTGGWPEISTLKPMEEKGSSAITFATSSTDGATYLYMTHSSFQYNDGGDYQGHITAINLTTGTQIVFNAACSDQGNKHFVDSGATSGANQNDCFRQQINDGGSSTIPAGNGGIWGRAAATYDPASDSIYISTGNGVYDPNDSMFNGKYWGDSVLRLPANLSTELFQPLDHYTPPNFLSLEQNDNDLGSTSLAIIPTSMTQGYTYTHLGIQSGKDSNLRILDLDDMDLVGGPLWGGGQNDSALYSAGVPQGNEVKTQPLVWQNPNDQTVMIIVSNDFGISASQLIMDGSHNPLLSHATAASWDLTGNSLSHGQTTGGGSPVIANGILYYASANGLVALDPATGNILVTLTDMGVSDKQPGIFKKQSPIVVNGRVYVTDENSNLWVYEGDDIFNNGFD
jgi:hypothetical protein